MSTQVKMKPTIKYPYMGDKVAKRLFDIESKPKRMLVSYIIAHELNMDVLDVYNNILVLSINPSISNQTVGAELDLNYYIRESSYIVNLEANTYDNEKAKVKNQNYIYLLATKDIKSSDDYNNPKKILQLNFDTFDIYHDGEVSYTIEPREIKKNRPGGFNFKSIHYNLTYFKIIC